MTSNSTHIIMSDGSSSIYILDPHTLKTMEEIPVTDNGIPVKWINELEWIDGLVYANIYQTECIAQINPVTGGVVGWVHLKGLKDEMLQSISSEEQKKGNDAPEVLNGIAWDGKRGRLFVTGKLWPTLYQIELRPMYLDSKETDVAGMTQEVRRSCIINYQAFLDAMNVNSGK